LIISLLASIHFISAQDPQISYSKTVHDFGTIGDQDGLVTHEFFVTNNSNQPLVISRVVPSCGCTTPSWTKEPIEPGGKGFIKVDYNPVGNQGDVTKTIRVTTNLNPVNTTLYIKAKVEKGNSDPTKAYPIAVGNLLLKQTPELDFGQINSTEKKTIDLEVYNNGTENLSGIFSLPPYITAVPEIIPSKVRARINFTFDPEKYEKIGLVKGAVAASVGSTKITVPFKGFIKENFDKLTPDEINSKGKINLSTEEITFSKNTKDNSVVLKIANSGKSNLNIKEIQSENSNITFSKNNLTVKPNDISVVKVKYQAPKNKMPETPSVIYILSDDPKNPVKEIRVLIS
ncbi:MAG: DUF1573 domain-containing protein, partial [Bacteroidales bacterium]|nr:DUF1573 domain-containing protein [Bacteroidales bacterium]